MTGITTPASFDTDHDHARRSTLPLGVASLAVATVWTVLGAHDMSETATVVPVLVVVAAAVFGFLVPRALSRPSAGGTALALSLVAAALTLPAYWSGLPLVLGAAGALLGYVGRNAATGSGKSIAAIVLGALAVIGYLTIYIVDGLVFGNL